MKTWEALKAADEGEKIRRKCWMKGVYSIKEENSWAGDTALMTHYKLGNKFGTCDNVSLERLEWDDIFASDWEIYEEECRTCPAWDTDYRTLSDRKMTGKKSISVKDEKEVADDGTD